MTSQIFANVYLNEFDRYVRHTLKPLAYLRYGDDFLLFCPTRQQTHLSRQKASQFLAHQLKLAINTKNDFIFATAAGLKFLGHEINVRELSVDKTTTKSALNKLNWHNAASYKSLNFDHDTKKRLDWILLEKSVDI